MKTSEVIRTAMGHVEKGWTKNVLQDDLGNVCAAGALIRATGGEIQGQRHFLFGENRVGLLRYNAARDAVENTVEEQGYSCIPAMNDHLRTTKQDMLNIMEKTAISLEEHGE